MIYADLRDALFADPTLEHGSGATEQDLESAIAALGRLPDDYQEFAREFGWVAFRGYEIYGIGQDLLARHSLVQTTVDERALFGLPSHLIAIMNDGGGNLFCFDTRAEPALRDAVFFRDHETGFGSGVLKIEADSFSAWLLDLLRMSD